MKDNLIQEKTEKINDKNKLSNKLSGVFGNKSDIKKEIKIINQDIKQLDKKIKTTQGHIDNNKKLLKENKIPEKERIDMHNYINQYFYAKQIKK